MRLIDADEFLKTQIHRCGCVPLIGSCLNDANSLKEELEQISPIYPVHGRWVMDGEYHCHCSNCQEGRNIKVQIGWNYCPNCGAKMDGGK